jgi:hypothetical protein
MLSGIHSSMPTPRAKASQDKPAFFHLPYFDSSPSSSHPRLEMTETLSCHPTLPHALEILAPMIYFVVEVFKSV